MRHRGRKSASELAAINVDGKPSRLEPQLIDACDRSPPLRQIRPAAAGELCSSDAAVTQHE
jgi:hypothetical protein